MNGNKINVQFWLAFSLEHRRISGLCFDHSTWKVTFQMERSDDWKYVCIHRLVGFLYWGLFKYRKGPAQVSQVKNYIDIKGVIFWPNLMYMQIHKRPI